MPKENKKRGRRAEERKRKHDANDEDDTLRKKLKQSTDEPGATVSREVSEHDPTDDAVLQFAGPEEAPFVGMLDEEEQEYFKRADDMLEMNQFNDNEERALFLSNLYKEAEGKELKIAYSQSCSRMMERLIQSSSPGQLKRLFQSFSGQFLHLIHHRFASHCCEALFLHAAPMVTQEMTNPPKPDSSDPSDIFVPMEDLFLYALDELEGFFGFLMTDRYGSHILRTLLIVLSGDSLSSTSSKSLFQSKRKENVTISKAAHSETPALEKRAVPDSFHAALDKVIKDSVSGLDTTYLRALATHPTGNPVLQLLLKIELVHFGKQRAKDETSIIHKLLPDDTISEGTESASFVNGLVYDIVGSRLLEAIVEFAPSKLFKSLYREFFKERTDSLSRNEIAGYVVCKMMERVGKHDLADMMQSILPQVKGLVERGRTVVIKTLIDRCVAREVDTQPIAQQLETCCSGTNGFDIARLLKPGEDGGTDAVRKKSHQLQSDKTHGSLLAQAMIGAPGSLSELVFDSLVRSGPALSLKIAKDATASRTVQAALVSPHASIIFRRKMIQQFYGNIGEMALDPSASHVIDSIWEGTHGLAFIRERVAEELAENEASLRQSFVGRAVWRNWDMDLYKRRRGQWVSQSRKSAGNDGFVSFPEDQKEGKPKKTAIQLARERHAAKNKKTGHAKEQQPSHRDRESKLELETQTVDAPRTHANMTTNGLSLPDSSADHEPPLMRAGEVQELFKIIKHLTVPFIRQADQDAAHKFTGHGLAIQGQSPRTSLVEHHPPEKLASILNLDLPEVGKGKDGLVDILRIILQYSVNTWDQGFMDKLYGATNPVGIVSECILAVLNTNVHVYQVSPVLTLIEKHTAKAFAALYGFIGPHAGGISQPGGSASNQTSIIIARNNLYPETKTDGYGSRRFVLFTSAHGHYSLEKAAQMFGFGSKAVKSVPVDGSGKMIPTELEKAIESALSVGETPFYVNATAGTTVLGSYDSIDKIADVCQKHGLWLHVDGSWGGSVVFSDSLKKERLKGIARADTVAVTPHKMLGVPLTCSFLLGKDLRQFHKANTLPAGYLFHTENTPNAEIYDLADLTPQCGRKGDALKLFLGWSYYGKSGYATLIEHAFSVASHLYSLLNNNSKFIMVSREPLPCLQVCFYRARVGMLDDDPESTSRDTAEIVRRLVPRGFMIDYAPGQRGKFFRVVVGRDTRKETVEGLVKAIEIVAAEVDAER
ncbi:PLP-dependent transferase [Aulographum hederae CBS 113979]|uniref:PLP-dependent transferase n=1 Tax=Aulographum hederae CBS 113979 TaxID=1176131 RepID=A0A6G1H3F8_9PEZI|nr:PLP-dependent transferase [Aulographum hederae CBS 113979]